MAKLVFKRLKQVWRIRLQKTVSQLEYRVKTSYYGGRPIPIHEIDWADRITDCFSIVVDQGSLAKAIKSRSEVDLAEMAEILPVRPYKDLVEDYQNSDLPIGSPPRILTDTTAEKTANEVAETVSLDYHLTLPPSTS